MTAPSTSSSIPPPTTTTTTTTAAAADQDAPRLEPAALPAAAAELARAKITLERALRRFADFPIPGINFLDIMPWFLDPVLHETLLRSLELQLQHFGPAAAAVQPDVVVGLDARGFLFGPSLALRLGVSFVPVRKQGKLPGPCKTAEYMKEYGADYFQIQEGAIKPGQKVLIVDDIIATGTLSFFSSFCGNAFTCFFSCGKKRRVHLTSTSRNADKPQIYRWFRHCRRRSRQAARRHARRLPLHRRDPLPQGPREARRRCASRYAAGCRRVKTARLLLPPSFPETPKKKSFDATERDT